MQLNEANIPQKLKEYPHWCLWRYEQKKGKRKPDKVPYNPLIGRRARPNDPGTFAPFADTLAAFRQGGYDGLGIGLFECSGFEGIFAIDLDGHFSPITGLSEIAQSIITATGSYTEISPSGTGLRIIAFAPGFVYDSKRHYIKNGKSGLEIYTAGGKGRFVTITGNVYHPAPVRDCSEQLPSVLEAHMLRPSTDRPTTPQRDVPGSILTDEQILEKAAATRNGEAFTRLMEGDTSKFNEDHSAADLALCNVLAYWCGGDAEQMDRLFRQSDLYREKWERDDYRKATIEKAVRDCKVFYGHSTTAAEDFAEWQTVKPADFSDTGNAEVFEQIHHDTAIWTRGAGWFVWNSKYWEANDHRALALARDLSSQMLKEALTAFYVAQRKAIAEGESKELAAAKSYLNHAQKTRQKTRTDAMLALAQAGLWQELAVFDPNPLDLNTPAGIVDLATGAIRPHSPAAMCSKITRAAPGMAGMQMWLDLLQRITGGDASLIEFHQQVAGAALVGKVYHEGIVIACGSGRNGKSTYYNAIADVLGGYAGHIAVNTLTTERTNKGATLATLRGKRLILTGELEEHQRLSVATLKALASTDTLVAEEKFRAPEEFKQSHTICLFTNHLPRVGSTDGGTWRRLIVIPFDAVISAENAIQNYGEFLAEKAGPAILQWCIKGAVKFVGAGYRLAIPDRVARATEEYQARENWLSNFIAERCTAGSRVTGGELYAAYRAWSESAGEYVRRQSDFVSAMESAGYKKIMSNGRNYWLGLALNIVQVQYPSRSFTS